ncbi:MAG: hypothetical protein ACI9EF_001322 [Pseudohongiellaceae bacterium]|jgi:hypothetical protein
MTSDLVLPGFLGIGAVKAGTTWLHHNLRPHPGLYLPIQKPVYFWDRHREKGLESYSRILSPGREQLIGEFTAAYSVLPKHTKQELRELIPDLKLVLVLREPKSRAWSEARMELTLIQERDASELTTDDYLEFLRSKKCTERGDYPAMIRAWLEFFPREQLFIGLYDDIIRRPQGFLTEIFNFLEVDVPDDWSGYPFTKKIFGGPVIEIPEACAALLDEMYGEAEIAETAELSGLDLQFAWLDA